MGKQEQFVSRKGKDQKLCFENFYFGWYVDNKKEGMSFNGKIIEEVVVVIYVYMEYINIWQLIIKQLQEVEEKEGER